MRLGLDLYSVRSQGWDAFRLLDYCHGLGVDVAHFGLHELGSTEAAHLAAVRARADELGLELEIGIGSICETSTAFRPQHGSAVEQAHKGLALADALGSRVLKVLLGGGADRHTETPLSTHIAHVIATLKAVREQAMDLGITLAVENHTGDMQGRELRALIEAAGPEYVGACFDSGNSVWSGETPMTTYRHIAPYIVTSHLRDSIVFPHPRGAAWQWVAIGDGNVGFDEVARRMVAECPRASFTLEIITGRPPRVMPYLEPAYWEVFRETPAHEFAQFVETVGRGEPFMGHMIVADGAAPDAPPEYAAALVAQQRVDVERSVKYCQETLKVQETF